MHCQCAPAHAPPPSTAALPYTHAMQAEPAVELQSSSPCTCSTFLPTGSHMLGGYADGSLRLITLQPEVSVAWALSRHSNALVAVAAHPLKPLALTAARYGREGCAWTHAATAARR